MRFAVRKRAEFEMRRSERMRLEIAGKMIVPAEDVAIDCRVVDLSDSGAGVVCDEMPPLHAFTLLYVEGFGRYEAVVARVEGNVLGLRFVFNDRKRKGLVEKLARFVETGALDPTATRKARRVPGPSAASFVTESGERVPCEVADISLTGASLKTHARPLIGEVIKIGRMPARVVRYHDRGIAVVFEKNPQALAASPSGEP
ncbi:MAG TPA: PilZ domain-containing protein [Rhizomicrobium sp.]|nr:PilZ domain-containing protein [Rhizomicrobium sp.]